MIEAIDSQLLGWAESLLTDATVTLAAPGPHPEGRGASLYFYQLAPAPPPRDGRLPPLQAYARYLVTTWAATPEDAHALLETLLFAAMDESAYEVDLSPIVPDLWARFGVTPQPAFVLSVLLKRERMQPTPQRVRRPLQVDTALMVTVNGLVLGPEDVPLAHAQVELPALQLSLHTDAAGRFCLPNVPAGPLPVQLRVRARGKQLEVAVPAARREEPLIIRFASFD